jgi:hypothetical protein
MAGETISHTIKPDINYTFFRIAVF